MYNYRPLCLQIERSQGLPQGAGCKNDSSVMSHLITGYVYDTMVYYARAKQLIERSRNTWADILMWANKAVRDDFIGKLTPLFQ